MSALCLLCTGIATIQMLPTSLTSAGAGAIAAAVTVVLIGFGLHQIAHVVVARGFGAAISEIKLGPVLAVINGNRIRIARNHVSNGVDGFSRVANRLRFPEGDRTGYVLAIAAGPAAAIVWCSSVLSLAILTSPGPDWLVLGLMAGAMAGLAWTALDLFPAPRQGISTDGSRIVAAFREQKVESPAISFGEWLDAISGPASPGNWPEEVIEAQEAILIAKGSSNGDDLELAIVAGYLLYLHYADRHEWAEANHVITSTVELPRDARQLKRVAGFDLIDIVYAIHLSLRGNNALGGQSSLDRLGKRSPWRKSSLADGAQAAIALAAGDPETAALYAAKAKRLLSSADDSLGISRLLSSWWDEVLVSAHRPLRPMPLAPDTARSSMGTIIPFPAVAVDRFGWDPGVASDYRTIWIWRRRSTLDLTATA